MNPLGKLGPQIPIFEKQGICQQLWKHHWSNETQAFRYNAPESRLHKGLHSGDSYIKNNRQGKCAFFFRILVPMHLKKWIERLILLKTKKKKKKKKRNTNQSRRGGKKKTDWKKKNKKKQMMIFFFKYFLSNFKHTLWGLMIQKLQYFFSFIYGQPKVACWTYTSSDTCWHHSLRNA